ncbi:MAG: VPA1267 family protein [bacterium]
MANGQQMAEENLKKFSAWATSKTDEDFRSLALRGVLSRTDIAAECGFAKSALSQNPRIREALKRLEEELRSRGVLPQMATAPGDTPGNSPTGTSAGSLNRRDAERLKRLEQENASLRAELAEVKRALSRYAVLQEALADTRRLPR